MHFLISFMRRISRTCVYFTHETYSHSYHSSHPVLLVLFDKHTLYHIFMLFYYYKTTYSSLNHLILLLLRIFRIFCKKKKNIERVCVCVCRTKTESKEWLVLLVDETNKFCIYDTYKKKLTNLLLHFFIFFNSASLFFCSEFRIYD